MEVTGVATCWTSTSIEVGHVERQHTVCKGIRTKLAILSVRIQKRLALHCCNYAIMSLACYKMSCIKAVTI